MRQRRTARGRQPGHEGRCRGGLSLLDDADDLQRELVLGLAVGDEHVVAHRNA